MELVRLLNLEGLQFSPCTDATLLARLHYRDFTGAMLWQGLQSSFKHENSLIECNLFEDLLPCLFALAPYRGATINRGLNRIQFW